MHLSKINLQNITRQRAELAKIESGLAGFDLTNPLVPAALAKASKDVLTACKQIDSIIRLGTKTNFDKDFMPLVKSFFYIQYLINLVNSGGSYISDKAKEFAQPIFTTLFGAVQPLASIIQEPLQNCSEDDRLKMHFVQEDMRLMLKKGTPPVSLMFMSGIGRFADLIIGNPLGEHKRLATLALDDKCAARIDLSDEEAKFKDLANFLSVYAADKIGLRLGQLGYAVDPTDWDFVITCATEGGISDAILMPRNKISGLLLDPRFSDALVDIKETCLAAIKRKYDDEMKTKTVSLHINLSTSPGIRVARRSN